MSEYDLHRKTNLPSQVAFNGATKSFTPSAEIPDIQLTDLLARRDRPRAWGGLSAAALRTSLGQIKTGAGECFPILKWFTEAALAASVARASVMPLRGVLGVW